MEDLKAKDSISSCVRCGCCDTITLSISASDTLYLINSNLAEAGFGQICYVQIWLQPESDLNLHVLLHVINRFNVLLYTV
jgi:hypothetical protein